jgi:hypothetical protein
MTNQDQTNQDQSDETMDMLDETLDDLADMPETKPFPAGAHLASVKIKRNPKKTGAYVVEMVHTATVELSNPSDTEPKEGDKSTMFISTKKKDGTVNEFGQGQLKMFLKPIAAMLGTGSINECLAATKDGISMIVVCGIRKSKDDNYDDQQSVSKVELAE